MGKKNNDKKKKTKNEGIKSINTETQKPTITTNFDKIEK